MGAVVGELAVLFPSLALGLRRFRLLFQASLHARRCRYIRAATAAAAGGNKTDDDDNWDTSSKHGESLLSLGIG